jgi:hypothetical protein
MHATNRRHPDHAALCAALVAVLFSAAPFAAEIDDLGDLRETSYRCVR